MSDYANESITSSKEAGSWHMFMNCGRIHMRFGALYEAGCVQKEGMDTLRRLETGTFGLPVYQFTRRGSGIGPASQSCLCMEGGHRLC